MSAEIKHIEVILKIVERCNINCSYCYFFNGLDDSFKYHPKSISKENIDEVVRFLEKGCKDLKLKSLKIDFHGGEPLLQKKRDFDFMCSLFTSKLSSLVPEVRLSIQTNAMLIDSDWINLFEKHNVFVGVSLDGPKEYNDKYRVDFKSKGTYDKTVAGIKLLKEAAKKQRIAGPGALCVINPAFLIKKIYRHFVDDLEIKSVDFLLPDFNHETFQEYTNKTGFTALDYGKSLCDLFDEWTRDDNPQINVRILKSAMSLLHGGGSNLLGFGPAVKDYFAFTIASNGDVEPDDTLKSANPALLKIGANIKTTRLADFINHPLMEALIEKLAAFPDKCRQCCWENICGAGMDVHRYSKNNQFSNESVMCEGLRHFYTHITQYSLSNGCSFDDIKKVLLK